MSPQSVLSWIPVVRELASLFAELWRMPQEQRHAQARASADCARADLAPAARRTVHLALTQAELAAAAGLARETVNRVLGRLEAAGFVETGRGEVLVYDLEGLRDWAG